MYGQENHKGKYRNYILVITGLAVFNFLFLGTEYFFDDRMAELVPAGMGTEHYSDNQCSRISGLSDSETISGKPTRDGHADYFRSDLYVKYLDDDW